jgi:anti-anti-sigma factor
MDEFDPTRDGAPRIDVALSQGPFAGVVALTGEHDVATQPQLDETLAAIYGSVLVDLTDCRFIDSVVIGTLVHHARRVGREGHRLEAVVPPANATMTRIVAVCGLRDVVRVHDRRPEDDQATSRRPSPT